MRKFLGDLFLGWWKDRDADIGVRLLSWLLSLLAAEACAIGGVGLLRHYIPVLWGVSPAMLWVFVGVGIALMFPVAYMASRKKKEVKNEG